MPRPLRIEYENAYYHVMNRGGARQPIFDDDEDRHAFLDCLEQAHARFSLQILCYCLMDNHYHLLVKTPEANLGRAMRHINGVYTQRFNRRHKMDGSLFRGRYKAICVESDSYQLQLSRYIHRNPLEAAMVNDLAHYPWSSYPYYVSSMQKPEWLYQHEIYRQLLVKSKLREKYQAYVERGIDEELIEFYSKGRQAPYLGSDIFRDWVYQQRCTADEAVSQDTLIKLRPSIEEMVELVAVNMNVEPAAILTGGRGRGLNLPRQVAMYLCQQRGGYRLKDIASAFGLKNYGSVAGNISKLKQTLLEDKILRDRINDLI